MPAFEPKRAAVIMGLPCPRGQFRGNPELPLHGFGINVVKCQDVKKSIAVLIQALQAETLSHMTNVNKDNMH